ncbi:hypothetical protein J8402_11110 [Chromohalobacter israelensis]|uniref:hypothetical protein n=1 Tax=Chromohalobacter israelensis TaxID=141390 RepID=UPI003AF89FF0
MDFYLQMGHGMKAMTLELINKWGGGTAILSPRHMTLEQMKKASSEIHSTGGKVLLDPQFYFPRTSDGKLKRHAFWPDSFSTFSFFNGGGIDTLIDCLIDDYFSDLNLDSFIIPSLLCKEADNDWDAVNQIIINSVARRKNDIDTKKYFTLCLEEKLIRDEQKVHDLIDTVSGYDVDGFYIIPEHPDNKYLVDDVQWLTNLLDLTAGLKLTNKEVIVGYSSHQMLLLSLAKIDGICAGSWLKTRIFPTADFDEKSRDNEIARKSTWYYCPQALSEYQIPFLTIAYQNGSLDALKPAPQHESGFSKVLFQGASPDTVKFPERSAFQHYLASLKKQCEEINFDEYQKAKTWLKLQFETANDLSSYFRSQGIRGKAREFSNVAEDTLASIDAFDSRRGINYQLQWSKI